METPFENTSRRRTNQLQVTVSSTCRSSKSGVLDCMIYWVACAGRRSLPRWCPTVASVSLHPSSTPQGRLRYQRRRKASTELLLVFACTANLLVARKKTKRENYGVKEIKE
nr:uncharacterized protein LOC109771629 [Aegilops tauschii subsp. strangulata]